MSTSNGALVRSLGGLSPSPFPEVLAVAVAGHQKRPRRSGKKFPWLFCQALRTLTYCKLEITRISCFHMCRHFWEEFEWQSRSFKLKVRFHTISIQVTHACKSGLVNKYRHEQRFESCSRLGFGDSFITAFGQFWRSCPSADASFGTQRTQRT